MQEAHEIVQENSALASYEPDQFDNVAEMCGIVTDKLLTTAMEVESMDNLSVVILSFPNFTRFLQSLKTIPSQATLVKENEVYSGKSVHMRN